MPRYGKWRLKVYELPGKIDRGELVPDPEWQRGYIWKQKDKELLIDSIIKKMPIPKFYVTTEFDSRKKAPIQCVVDGQQRIRSIYDFVTNQFAIEIDDKEYYFKDLSDDMQQEINVYDLDGHALENYQPSDINFLFKRLNTTGIKLTNMEEWNNEFRESKILGMVRAVSEEHKYFHDEIIYTADNLRRMLPLDDIIDLCNCLRKRAVAGGGKKDLLPFLKQNRAIAEKDSGRLMVGFRKVTTNLNEIFSTQDLESSLYRRRTHFLSLFLAIALMISEYYLLADPGTLKSNLLEFIDEQPGKYRKSVQGGIRHRTKRLTRVRMLQNILKKTAVELDAKRSFPSELRSKLWRQSKHTCGICAKMIHQFSKSVVDHIKPWSKGGPTDESNAQLAHQKCNVRKRDKTEKFVIS